MAEQSLKDKTVKGVLWSSIERFSVQGVQFLVMLVIARILDPKDFGLVGMLAIFIAIAQTLVDSGFSQALIRRKNLSETDKSTAFYFNSVLSCIVYLILFFTAPFIASFYNEPELCKMLRAFGLIVIINGLNVVQLSLYRIAIDFQTQARASFLAAVISGVAGIVLAIKGYGVWALVSQQVINAIVVTVALWCFSCWRPKWIYSWKSFRELFSYGSKMMAVAIIDTVYNNVFGLVIGKVYNAASLGYYTQADRFTKLPSSNITGVIQNVTYPVLCSIQDEDDRLRADYRKLLKMSAFVIFPLMCILAGISYPLVEILLGEKWLFAASLIIPLSFGMMWYPIHAINLNLLQVKGRSDLFLKLEIMKKAILIVVLIIVIPFGVEVMCYSTIFTSLVSLCLNTYYTGKIINVGLLMQLKDLFGTLVLSMLIFIIVFSLPFLIGNVLYTLIIGILAGGGLWCGISCLFKFEEIEFLKTILKKK